jgi:uncharacterized protein (DUF1697 family)
MHDSLGRTFYTIVRSSEFLRGLQKTDPYAEFAVSQDAKRLVTFMRQPPKTRVALPIESDGARILRLADREVFTVYVRSEKGPVFMTLIEKAFGADVTTRTWETVRKCAVA